jgi:TRAP-type C4-dicarboxylate transport system substrate-binding protein
MFTRSPLLRLITLFGAALHLIAPPHAGAEQFELTIATTHTVNTPWVHVLKAHFVPEFTRRARAEADTEIRWIEVYGGALSKWTVSLETVATGLADIGWVGSLWEPSKLPLQNITYHLPFITDDLAELVRTFNQIHHKLPAVRQAWLEQNQVFLGATGIDTYHLLTNFPVRTLDDLKGRKILAPVPSAVWLRGTGAVPVDGALSTYYTQLKTGVADGTVSILTGAHPYRIHEVAPYITLVGIGAQITGALTINLDTFRRLPERAQEILYEMGNEYSERSVAETLRRYDSALATLTAEGAIVATMSAQDKRRWIEGLPEYGQQWVARHERKGLPAGQMLTLLMDALRDAGLRPQRDWDRFE